MGQLITSDAPTPTTIDKNANFNGILQNLAETPRPTQHSDEGTSVHNQGTDVCHPESTGRNPQLDTGKDFASVKKHYSNDILLWKTVPGVYAEIKRV